MSDEVSDPMSLNKSTVAMKTKHLVIYTLAIKFLVITLLYYSCNASNFNKNNKVQHRMIRKISVVDYHFLLLEATITVNTSLLMHFCYHPNFFFKL